MKHFFILILFMATAKFILASVHQKKLLKDLFFEYNIFERPVANDSDALELSIGLQLYQILDINEKSQTFLFTGMFQMTWLDYSLSWNPEDYGNITFVQVLSNKIWIPDIALLNSADGTMYLFKEVLALIYSNGLIMYSPPSIFSVSCSIDLTQFPFDEQHCQINICSWTHSSTTLDLRIDRPNSELFSYKNNSEWDLEKLTTKLNVKEYEGFTGKYQTIVYELHLKRKTLYYVINLVLPCILISLICITGFCLPPDSGEKIGLEMTSLLSIITFSQQIVEKVPEGSTSMPRIMIFFLSISIVCVMSLISSVFVLSLHYRSYEIQGALPKWIENFICIHLARLVRMKRPSKTFDRNNSAKQAIDSLELKLNLRKSSSKPLRETESNGNENICLVYNGIDEMICVLNEVKLIAEQIQNEQTKGKCFKFENELKFAAMVIDRLCLLAFGLLTILTVLLFISTKNFLNFV